MKRAAQLFARVAATSLAALACLASAGCAEDEASTREAAYPVGYTPPAEQAAAQPPPSVRPVVTVNGATGQVGQVGQAGQLGASDRDVVVGDDEAAPEGPAPAAGPSSDEYTDTDPSALTDFRTALDPYGSWHDDPTYGTVWVPSQTVVGSDFTPYATAGHWVYDDDYTWVSDYDWGWAPFHYGRWVYGVPGWEWIPGRVYAGAWVSWRYGVDEWAYVGWAPLPPLWCWRGGLAVGIGFVPYAPYAFVPSAHLFAPAIGGHLARGAEVGPIASHTQPWAPAGAGRVVAHPTVSGPPPASLHIQSAAVAHASGSTAAVAQVAQARAFSRPNTAVALGARPPQGNVAAAGRASMVAPSRVPYSASAASRPSYSLGSRPSVGSASYSHFGGKLGGGFAGSAASAPPSRPYYASSAPSSAPSGQTYRSSAPGYHASAPSYHSFASSVPGYHGGSGGGGGFHAGGGGGGFSGGGFHGGGGGGSHSGGGGGHGGGHR